MMRSLWTAASGMRAQQTNVDTIANNIANVNTIGYKTQDASFKSLLYQNLQSTSTNNAGDQKPVAAEVGLGSRVAAITSNFEQGKLTPSTNPFAMAIEGKGFFQIRVPSGEIQYTRDGNFNVSPTENGNLLCTTDGYPVLDTNGNSINFPLNKNSSDVIINQDGTIGFANSEGHFEAIMNNGQPVKLGLVQFNNPAGLSKESGNNFSVTPASGDPILEGTSDQVTPSKIHQKYIESSNVDVANEMVNLIVAQRAYEMNSKAIQATDEMMQQANNLR